MVELFRLDRSLTNRGYTISFAIDSSEILRYLQPDDDHTRRLNPERFLREQLALHYLFSEESNEKLILLSSYYEELRDHYKRIRERVVRMYTHYGFADKGVREERLLSYNTRDIETEKGLRGALESAKQQAIDLLVSDRRERRIAEAMDTFWGLVDRQKIISEVALTEKGSHFQVDEGSEEFVDLLADLNFFRGGRHAANIVDARALFALKDLNESNLTRKRIILLISSARAITPSLNQVRVSFPAGQEVVDLPLVRNPYYVLLRFYFDGANSPDAEERLSDIGRVFEETRAASDKLKNFVKGVNAAELPAAVVDEVEQAYEEAVTPLRTFSEGLNVRFEPGEEQTPEQLRGVLRVIDDLVASPDRFRGEVEGLLEHLRQAGDRLNKIAVLLDVPTVETISSKMPPPRSYLYPIIVQDSKFQEDSGEIVSLLEESSVESIRKAKAQVQGLLLKQEDSVDVYVIAARAYLRLSALDAAEYAIARAQELAKDSQEVSFSRCLLAKRKERWDEAIGFCENAHRKSPKDARFSRELAFLYWKKGDLIENEMETQYVEKALDLAMESIKNAEPGSLVSVLSMNDLAYYLARRAKSEEDMFQAADWAEKAIGLLSDLGGEHADFFDTAGFVKLQHFKAFKPKGKELLNEALAYFMHAIEIERSHRTAHKHMKEVLELHGMLSPRKNQKRKA